MGFRGGIGMKKAGKINKNGTKGFKGLTGLGGSWVLGVVSG